MPKPVFYDNDPSIRAAREVAHYYLHKITLHNPALYDEQSIPRNLADTLRQELALYELDEDMKDKARKIEEHSHTPKDYDPEREQREIEALESAVRKEILLKIFAVMELLADENQPRLDSAKVREHIIPLLKSAPQFIAQQVIVPASQTEIEARENLTHVDKITREIASRLYPKLPPEAAEFTSSDRYHTREILKFSDDRSRVVSLALNNFLDAVQKVNAALEGSRMQR